MCPTPAQKRVCLRGSPCESLRGSSSPFPRGPYIPRIGIMCSSLPAHLSPLTDGARLAFLLLRPPIMTHCTSSGR
jgi:hypothetical protein